MTQNITQTQDVPMLIHQGGIIGVRIGDEVYRIHQPINGQHNFAVAISWLKEEGNRSHYRLIPAGSQESIALCQLIQEEYRAGLAAKEIKKRARDEISFLQSRVSNAWSKIVSDPLKIN